MAYSRIISLVPSLTELIIDLGLKDRLAGRTRFCIHPAEEVKDIPIIGGTKKANMEKIRAINPDYILTNKEENTKADIEALREEFHVALTEIDTVEDALLAIYEIGGDLEASAEAGKLISKINELLDSIPQERPQTAAYFIWREPWMVTGRGTYIHDVLEKWGLKNVFGDTPRYPTIQLTELKKAYPDLILLSSEPYPFKEKHIEEIREACPAAQIMLVDGEWFSWYGSRMIPAFKGLNDWRAAL